MLMAKKKRLPVGHPSVDRYVCVNNSVPKPDQIFVMKPTLVSLVPLVSLWGKM